MINITNRVARQLYHAEMTRIMMVLENIQARELKPVLNRQYMNTAKLAQQRVLDAVDHAVNQERSRLTALIGKHYKRVITTFGKKAFKIIEGSKNLNIPEIKGPKDEFWAEMNRWTSSQAAMKIRHIQKTSKKLIANVIYHGQAEGESHREIAKRIRKTGKITTPYRARTIAITETHTAAVKSVDVAVKSTRIEMEREWLAVGDRRTRPWHAEADGVRVGQEGKFIIGGMPMAYPGDPAGGADNTVRCRCNLLYHTVRRSEPMKPYEPKPAWKPVKTVEEAREKLRAQGRVGYLGVEGYSKGESVKIANEVGRQVTDLYDRFPKLDRVLDKKRHHDLWNMYVHKGKNIPGSSNVFGEYRTSVRTMELAGSTQKRNLLKIGKANWNVGTDFGTAYRHELGHHILDVPLSFTEKPALRKKWVSLYKEKGQGWFGKKVSKYSETNFFEGFCESFAAYTSPLYGQKYRLPKAIEGFFDEFLKTDRWF